MMYTEVATSPKITGKILFIYQQDLEVGLCFFRLLTRLKSSGCNGFLYLSTNVCCLFIMVMEVISSVTNRFYFLVQLGNLPPNGFC